MSRSNPVTLTLPIELAVYVPSTKDANVPVTDAQMAHRIAETQSFLSALFGGHTTVAGRGGYVSQDKGLISEPVIKITAFATVEGWTENKPVLDQWLSDKAKEWGQETIGFEVEGDFMMVNPVGVRAVFDEYQWSVKYSSLGFFLKANKGKTTAGRFSCYMTDDGMQNDIWVNEEHRSKGLGFVGTVLLIRKAEDLWNGFQWDIRGLTTEGKKLAKRVDEYRETEEFQSDLWMDMWDDIVIFNPPPPDEDRMRKDIIDLIDAGYSKADIMVFGLLNSEIGMDELSKCVDDILREMSVDNAEPNPPVSETGEYNIHQLNGRDLKKRLDAKWVRKRYENKHKDGGGNFGYTIKFKNGSTIIFDGDYDPTGNVYYTRVGAWGSPNYTEEGLIKFVTEVLNTIANEPFERKNNPPAKLPIDMSRVSRTELNRQALRTGIEAELDAVNLYEQLAQSASADARKLFLDIAKEEKTHVGEFQAMLLKYDKEQEAELEAGAEEALKFNPPRRKGLPMKFNSNMHITQEEMHE